MISSKNGISKMTVRNDLKEYYIQQNNLKVNSTQQNDTRENYIRQNDAWKIDVKPKIMTFSRMTNS